MADTADHEPTEVTLRKQPTRAQVMAAQLLLDRTKIGYGRDTPLIRAIAAATPAEYPNETTD